MKIIVIVSITYCCPITLLPKGKKIWKVSCGLPYFSRDDDPGTHEYVTFGAHIALLAQMENKSSRSNGRSSINIIWKCEI